MVRGSIRMQKRKKIIWLNDLCPACQEGGTQYNDWNHIKFGMRRGYDIDIVTAENIRYRTPMKADLMIVSNSVVLNRSYIKDAVDAGTRFVVFNHDFNFCKFRLFYPRLDKCKICKNKDIWMRLFKQSQLQIFLSPKHFEGYLHTFPEIEGFKKAIIPSAIDVGMFKPVKGTKRKKDSIIGVNCMSDFKGRENILKYIEDNPKKRFTIVGSDEGLNYPNVEEIPYVPNKELPKMYSKHEHFIHLPEGIEPFGRTVMEALLCGCKIIGNDNVGALSYDWDYSNIEKVRKTLSYASLGFWESIEEAVGWAKEMGYGWKIT